MGFLSGNVTFQRYRVTEDPTGGFGESHLETLKKHVIGKSPGNIYENPDVGFSGGAHLCLLYTSPSPRDKRQSRMPSSA